MFIGYDETGQPFDRLQEAVDKVEMLRARQADLAPHTRQHAVTGIMLDWWERELASMVGAAATSRSVH